MKVKQDEEEDRLRLSLHTNKQVDEEGQLHKDQGEDA